MCIATDIIDHLFLDHLDYAHCPLSSVGDEYHLVFECPIFQPLRDKYHTLFNSRTSSMRSFFAQKDRMIVYKFVSDCLDMINT